MSLADGQGRDDTVNRPVIIGILGLGHSGSTLLERCIASHPDCVGVGEVDMTVRQKLFDGLGSFKPCTCGETAALCPLWGSLAGTAQDETDLVLEAIQGAVTISGRPVVVDSSKRTTQARVHSVLVRKGHVDLVPVYLFRDVRSWVVSRKVSREDRGTGTLGYIRRSWKWMLSILRGRHALRRMGVRPVLIRYEDFVADPEMILTPVFERAGLRQVVAIDPGKSCQHALNGNSMRYDPVRNSRIVVDEKWRSDWRTMWLAPFVFGPRVYNWLLRRQAAKSVRQGVSDGRDG